jgi:hypothetical protein
MTEEPHILLTSKTTVWIDPPDGRIEVSDREPAEELFPTYDDMLKYTHLAAGWASGRVSSEALLEGAEASQGATRVLLPLEGYDVTELADAVTSVLPARIVRGMVIIHPVLRPTTSPEVLRQGSPLRILVTAEQVGRPIEPFVLPKLVPNHPSSEATPFPELFERTPAHVSHFAGIAQIDDELETSHNLAQSIEGHPDGDYWHAIMHRREPDYGNSKYWFRHVGRHQVFAPLASRAAEIMKDAPGDVRSRWVSRLKVDAGWDPLAFVDMCEAAAGDEESELGLTARRIQWSEMLLLLRHCAQAKSSGS